MKKLFSLFVVLVLSITVWAQSPKLNYQAVVRDSENKLVVEQPITVTVNVLDAANASQFEQTLNATTNRNGLMSLEIGDETAAWNNINWNGAKIRTAVTFDGVEMVDTTLVNAVPSALYANSIDAKAIPQSDWAETDNDTCTFILNKPSISDTVNDILTNGNYVTTTMMDARIKDTLSKYTTTDQLCNVVNTCDLSGNASLQSVLQGFSDQIDAMNAKIDSLGHIVDSLTFVCGTSKVKDIDGNKYATVQIGEQCWMAQNLRTKIGETGDYGYPLDIANDSLLYGRMYSWDIATNSTAAEATDSKIQGICPAGWHIPTTTDINNIQGGVEALNLPKAGFYNTVSLSSFGSLGLIWTATTIENDGYNSVLGHSPKVYGYPVRCLKN